LRGLPAAMGVFDVDLALSRRLLAAPGRFIRYGLYDVQACHDRPDRDERFHAALVALAEAMERQRR